MVSIGWDVLESLNTSSAFFAHCVAGPELPDVLPASSCVGDAVTSLASAPPLKGGVRRLHDLSESPGQGTPEE